MRAGPGCHARDGDNPAAATGQRLAGRGRGHIFRGCNRSRWTFCGVVPMMFHGYAFLSLCLPHGLGLGSSLCTTFLDGGVGCFAGGPAPGTCGLLRA